MFRSSCAVTAMGKEGCIESELTSTQFSNFMISVPKIFVKNTLYSGL